MINRRKFLKSSVATGAMAISLPKTLLATVPPPAKQAGIQLYTLFNLMDKDPEGTLKKLASAGYKELEFAGPYYYSPEEELKSNVLINMFGLKNYGYYGMKPAELRRRCDDLGLKASSAHVSMQSLQHNIDAVIEAALQLDHKLIICPMLLGAQLEVYKEAADQFNTIGEKCKNAGIQFAYHNHSFEFGEIEGVRPMDYLMEQCDPGLVKFELDVFWVETAGVDAADYLKENGDRIVALHLKDMKERKAPDNSVSTFSNMQAIQAIFGNMTPIGSGVIDYGKVLKVAKKTAVQHYFLEQDFPPDQELYYRQAIKGFNSLT